MAPSRATIMGSFAYPSNVVRTANPRLHFRMDSTAAGFFETAVTGIGRDTTVRSERIAIVTGNRKGQSYLFWSGDKLYQLPISYWTGAGWANSPSYADGRPNFDRPIPPRCLECHATSVTATGTDDASFNRFAKDGAILGITCETCHGAGREHVRRERTPIHLLPRSFVSSAIVNPERLPRARQLDGCALCHSGVAPLQSKPFAFVPGQRLAKQNSLYDVSNEGQVDVHGNQVALLERSRCFMQSQMTCATCHDVHREQRDVRDLSGRCLQCHAVQSCGLFPRHGQSLAGRCVNCHMPNLTSTTVVSNDVGEQIRVRVRSHWIKVYPRELPGPAPRSLGDR